MSLTVKQFKSLKSKAKLYKLSDSHGLFVTASVSKSKV